MSEERAEEFAKCDCRQLASPYLPEGARREHRDILCLLYRSNLTWKDALLVMQALYMMAAREANYAFETELEERFIHSKNSIAEL